MFEGEKNKQTLKGWGWGHGGLLLGGVTTTPAATGDRPYLMSRLCPSPPGAGAGMPSETWGQASFLSSHAPSEAEHLVPKEGGGGRNEGVDLLIATPPLDVSLLYLAHISFHFMSPPLHKPSPILVPLFCCLALSCQTEKWQARQRSSAWGDGQERTGAYAQMHKWSVSPSAPVKLGTCCST